MKLVERAKNILLTPVIEWAVIKGEKLTIKEMFLKYAVYLAAIPAIAGFIGSVGGVILTSLFRRNYIYRPSFGSILLQILLALILLVLSYLLNLGGAYLLAFVIDLLAPTFGCSKNLPDSIKIAVYSLTAYWVAGVFNFIPIINILFLMAGGAYSLYLIFLGMQKIKAVAQDKMVGYFVVTIVATGTIYFMIIIIPVIITVIFTTILGRL
jgi:hypothetical protein